MGGLALLVATALFIAVFSYLASTFGYPDVLDRPADEVLPALRALGPTGWSVWLIYGWIPLLLVPTALGVREAARMTTPRLARLAVPLAMLSTASMMAGLLRWPTLHWWLAGAWTSADAAERTIIAARFAAANLYLGNVVGEFAGELFLNGFLLVASLAVAGARPGRRWLAVAGTAASALGWLAMLRNLTPLVATIAAINNAVLPLWMIVLGVMLLRTVRATR
ncbi:MAG: DUF4386 family protein [Vicinamibacterales bacterium]